MATAALDRGADPRRDAHRLRRWVARALPGAIASALLLAGITAFLQVADERRTMDERAQATALGMAYAIDREIAANLAPLRGLASSPALGAGDLKAFYDQLVATVVPEGTWLVLADADRQVLNTFRRYGDPLPTNVGAGPEGVAAIERTLRLDWSVDRIWGGVAQAYAVVVSLGVPTPHGASKFVLSMPLSEKRLGPVVAEQPRPSGWNALIVDRHGQPLVSTPPAARLSALTARHWLGQVLPGNARGLLGTSKPARGPMRVAYARPSDVEWAAVAVAPREIVDAPLLRAAKNLPLGGGLLLALGAVIGALLARWWQRSVDEPSVAAADGENKRRETEAQLERTQGLLRASSETLPARLAILDARGNVLFSNEAWRNFASSRRSLNGGPNANYLKVCESPVLRDTLRRLMKGERRTANVTYRVEGESEDSWYQAQLARYEHQDDTWYVIAHKDITEIKALRRTVHQLTDRLGRLQEEERRRIARELHDSTAQHLVGIGLNLMRLRPVLSGSAEAGEIYHELNASLQEAQKELRLFTYLLYPPSIGDEGLKATAERFVDGFATRAGVKMRRKICLGADRASFDVQCATFRILKEALTNVHRHAAASRVLVLMCTTEQELRLFVKDNGKGLGGRDATAGRDVPHGIGIPAMRALVRQLGGTLTVTSARRGTVVDASVPLRATERGRDKRPVTQAPPN